MASCKIAPQKTPHLKVNPSSKSGRFEKQIKLIQDILEVDFFQNGSGIDDGKWLIEFHPTFATGEGDPDTL
jgi:hypothetical protein